MGAESFFGQVGQREKGSVCGMDLATIGQCYRQGAVGPFSVCADASVVKEVASGATVNNGCIVRSVNGGRDGIGHRVKNTVAFTITVIS